MKQSKNILSIAALAVVCTMAWSGISASFAAAPLTSVKAKTVVSKPTPKKATATPKATTTIVPTATPEPTPVPTPVDIRLFSFTTVGDSRTDDTVQVLSSQDKIWLNNTPVMQRMMDDAVSNHSNLFLFNGDMIMGYTPDSNTNILNRQYAYWRGLVAQLFEKGVYVIPVPGNHETQDKYKDANGKTVKKATVANKTHGATIWAI